MVGKINKLQYSKNDQAKNDFEKDFYKILNTALYGKTMENVRNRRKTEFNRKYNYEKPNKLQSELTFHGIHISYTNYDSYTFKHKEVHLDKPIYLGFAGLKLSRFVIFETCYDMLQTYFGEKNTLTFYGY